MGIKNFAAVIQYDGSGFCGYQRQPSVRTVQSVIEAALCRLLGIKITVYAAGRTDKGVHGYGQVINFRTDTRIEISKLKGFLNRLLPNDVRILSIKEVDFDFNARISAKSRTYLYKIKRSSEETVFNSKYYAFGDVDYKLLMEEMSKFVGKHNFKYFSTSIDKDQTTIREIHSIRHYFDEKDNSFNIEIKGDSFLRGMIRIMVGTSIAVISGVLDSAFIYNALQFGDLKTKKNKASPSGLYLLAVEY